jgi:hypothetical protein
VSDLSTLALFTVACLALTATPGPDMLLIASRSATQGRAVEIGYFHPAAWGQGFATELVATCTDLADHTLELPKSGPSRGPRTSPQGAFWRNRVSKWCGSSRRWSAFSIDAPLRGSGLRHSLAIQAGHIARKFAGRE